MSEMSIQTSASKRREDERLQLSRKKKNVDRTFPEDLSKIIPEASAYHQMAAFEKKMDVMFSRKRLEFQEVAKRPMRSNKTIRIILSHLSTASPDGTYAWTLRIEGRVLDATFKSAKYERTSRFIPLIKSLIVILDRDPQKYPDGNLIEWKSGTLTNEADGFEIKRTGTQDVNVKIILNVDYGPDKFKVSPSLSEILGVHVETKAQILHALWHYVKVHKLQDSEDHRLVQLDDTLKSIFKVDTILLSALPHALQAHLQPIDPIIIPYTVRLNEQHHVSPVAYDVEIDTEDPGKLHLQTLVGSTDAVKEITDLEEKITDRVQLLHHSRMKRAFMLAFSESPVEFINEWIASQTADMKVLMGDSAAHVDSHEHSDLFSQPWAYQVVVQYLASIEREKPGSTL